MVFSFVYLAMRALLGALVRSRRGLHVKDIELLVLRHELEILRRQVAQPKLRLADRALLATAVCRLPRSSQVALLVTPRTLLWWHQALVRRKWRPRPASEAPSSSGHLNQRRQNHGQPWARSVAATGSAAHPRVLPNRCIRRAANNGALQA